MSFQDKVIQCQDCNADFTFSVEDQEYFSSKGYTNEPKRCPECRQARKTDRNGSRYSAPRQMYEATCTECGQTARVPFQPRGDKPVYCSDCFRKVRPAR